MDDSCTSSQAWVPASAPAALFGVVPLADGWVTGGVGTSWSYQASAAIHHFVSCVTLRKLMQTLGYSLPGREPLHCLSPSKEPTFHSPVILRSHFGPIVATRTQF